MGLFSSKKKEANKVDSSGMAPSLPELPKLPESPTRGDAKDSSKLPRYPSGSLGSTFSQNTIKDAVSGEARGDLDSGTDDLRELENSSMMQESLNNRSYLERRRNADEPVFVRIDKFEEALDIFEKTKDILTDMEKSLEKIKKTRDKEEEELKSWESEAVSMKNNIEKVDKDVFSKISY